MARWDGEGGAGPDGPQKHDLGETPADTSAERAEPELQQLHIRIIALENLVIALLADASEAQLDIARRVAADISPRSGSAHHPLTTYAARLMLSAIERAEHFSGPTTRRPVPE
ncbi:MAG: hypothetical protein ACRCUE_21440 [Bosea sp. (in: a-proteobacteria)]